MSHCYKCNVPNFAGEFVSYTGPQCQCWARYAPAHNVTRTRSEDAQTPHRGGSSYEASMLRNLLARIHRDGGHYVETHGLDKALAGADAQVVRWLAMQDELAAAPVAIMDTREALSLCAPTQDDFTALYALQGHRVALVDLGPT